jgi:hypothetical protein
LLGTAEGLHLAFSLENATALHGGPWHCFTPVQGADSTKRCVPWGISAMTLWRVGDFAECAMMHWMVACIIADEQIEGKPWKDFSKTHVFSWKPSAAERFVGL